MYKELRIPEPVGGEHPEWAWCRAGLQTKSGATPGGTQQAGIDRNEARLAFQSEVWGGDDFKAEAGSGSQGTGASSSPGHSPTP